MYLTICTRPDPPKKGLPQPSAPFVSPCQGCVLSHRNLRSRTQWGRQGKETQGPPGRSTCVVPCHIHRLVSLGPQESSKTPQRGPPSQPAAETSFLGSLAICQEPMAQHHCQKVPLACPGRPTEAALTAHTAEAK